MKPFDQIIDFAGKDNTGVPFYPEEIALILYAKQQRTSTTQRFILWYDVGNGFHNFYQKNSPNIFNIIKNVFTEIPIKTRWQFFILKDKIHWTLFDMEKTPDNNLSIFLFDAMVNKEQALELVKFWSFHLKNQFSTLTVTIRSSAHPFLQCDREYCAMFALDAAFRLEHIDLHHLLSKYQPGRSIPIAKLDKEITARLLRNNENCDKDFINNIYKNWANFPINRPYKPIKILNDRIDYFIPKVTVPYLHRYQQSYGFYAISTKSRNLIAKTQKLFSERKIDEKEYQNICNYFFSPTPEQVFPKIRNFKTQGKQCLPQCWWKYPLYFNF
jgi:hypothetical protein